MPDFRVATNWLTHPKTLDGIAEWGEPFIARIIRLWAHTSDHYPDGDLKRMSKRALGMICQCDDPRFPIWLIENGWIDETETGMSVHDWREHQPWLSKTDERSEQARINGKKGAGAKWELSRQSVQGEIASAKTTRSQRLSHARSLGTHTDEEWAQMVQFFGSQCVICNGILEHAIKDHIKPIYQGGSDSIQNLQPLCRSCNSRKGADNTDYRLSWCLRNACQMPSEWLAPSPSPSPSPSPKMKIKKEEEKIPASAVAEPPTDHKAFTEFFCRAYEERFAVPYDFERGKDGKHVKDLLAKYGLERLKAIAEKFLKSDDPFLTEKTGFTLSMLRSQINRHAVSALGKPKAVRARDFMSQKQTADNIEQFVQEARNGNNRSDQQNGSETRRELLSER